MWELYIYIYFKSCLFSPASEKSDTWCGMFSELVIILSLNLLLTYKSNVQHVNTWFSMQISQWIN